MLSTDRTTALIQQLTRGQSLNELRSPSLPSDQALAKRVPELAQQFFGSQGTRVGYLAQAYMDPSAVGSAANVLESQLADAGFRAQSTNSALGAGMFLFAVQAIRDRLMEDGPRQT
ncbi:MAG: hypothetical protein IT290_10525 [Deltaproteobacteria bacterium]|nr:hypothetical protein [Deltaproteobacteria bacterium]